MSENNNQNNTSIVENNDFIQEALHDKFKKIFADEIKEAFLNQKEYWIGDIGYLTAEVKNQGTKSGEVIPNVKLKFKETKQFRKEINKALLDK